MNRKLEMLVGTYAAAIMLTSNALAEEPTPYNPPAETGTAPTEVPIANFGQTTKMSLLIGKDVKNIQGEKVGDVKDIIMDLSASRVVAVIISSGGFLGKDNELSIVPTAALQFVEGGHHLQLDVSKETLSQAPHFNENEWPDLGKAGYMGGVYKAYKVVPYYDDKSTQQPADNAEVNSSDNDNKKPTAFDQGNSKEDIAITAQIRRDVMALKDISMNAQNVKIITNKGHVTLRGPVNTAAEKLLIYDLAIKATSKANVDDQLEVK